MRTNLWLIRLRPHLRLIALALVACCLAGYLSGQAAAHQAPRAQPPVATAKDARPALASPSASQPQSNDTSDAQDGDQVDQGGDGGDGGNGGHGHGGKHHGG